MNTEPPRISNGPWLTPFAPMVLGRLRGMMCQHADGVTTILRPRRFSTVAQGTHVYQALAITSPAPAPSPSPSPSIPPATPSPSLPPGTPTPSPTPTVPPPSPSNVPPPTPSATPSPP